MTLLLEYFWIRSLQPPSCLMSSSEILEPKSCEIVMFSVCLPPHAANFDFFARSLRSTDRLCSLHRLASRSLPIRSFSPPRIANRNLSISASATMEPIRERQHWLMKAEPESRIVKGIDVKFSAQDFEAAGTTSWEGVRNHQAKVGQQLARLQRTRNDG